MKISIFTYIHHALKKNFSNGPFKCHSYSISKIPFQKDCSVMMRLLIRKKRLDKIEMEKHNSPSVLKLTILIRIKQKNNRKVIFCLFPVLLSLIFFRKCSTFFSRACSITLASVNWNFFSTNKLTQSHLSFFCCLFPYLFLQRNRKKKNI